MGMAFSGGPSVPAVPALKVATGRYHGVCAHQATASTNATGGADRMEITQWVAPATFTADLIAVNVTTNVAAALLKNVIYDSDANGYPNNLLLETGDHDCSTTGAKTQACTLTFIKGATYWIGVRHSSTAALSAFPQQSMYKIDFGTSFGAAVTTVLRRTLAYATPAPAQWGYVASEAIVLNPIAVGLRST